MTIHPRSEGPFPPPLLLLQAAAFVSLGAIVISTICFILGTFPDLQDPEDETYLQEEEEEADDEDQGGIVSRNNEGDRSIVLLCSISLQKKPLFPFWKVV